MKYFVLIIDGNPRGCYRTRTDALHANDVIHHGRAEIREVTHWELEQLLVGANV